MTEEKMVKESQEQLVIEWRKGFDGFYVDLKGRANLRDSWGPWVMRDTNLVSWHPAGWKANISYGTISLSRDLPLTSLPYVERTLDSEGVRTGPLVARVGAGAGRPYVLVSSGGAGTVDGQALDEVRLAVVLQLEALGLAFVPTDRNGTVNGGEGR